jgi:hypothetical protein
MKIVILTSIIAFVLSLKVHKINQGWKIQTDDIDMNICNANSYPGYVIL